MCGVQNSEVSKQLSSSVWLQWLLVVFWSPKYKHIHILLSLQTEYARFENGRFVYRINRSPMCEYMINFIHKLKHLPEKYMMNSVLENFTILLVMILSLSYLGRTLPWGLLIVRKEVSLGCTEALAKGTWLSPGAPVMWSASSWFTAPVSS